MSELALQLIAENKRTKNPKLDLGKCGLTEVPKGLFDCMWLEELVLSDACWDKGIKKMVESSNKGPNNYLTEIPAEIAKLQNLKSLKVGGWRRKIQTLLISDISFLQSLTGLQFLDLSSNGISDASILQSLTGLKYLSLRSNDISDTSFLQSLKKLKYLFLSKNHISQFSFLQSLPDLEYLDLSKNHISSISFLQPLTRLKYLSLRSNPISDFSFLQALPSLQSLNIGNNRILDYSFLKSMIGLQSLDLHNNQISDIGFLQSLTGLQSLDLHTNQISDFNFLKSLTSLKYLNLHYNPILEFSFLHSLTSLQSLDLSGYEISDISFLQPLTGLKSLDLSSNQISDIRFLQSLTGLHSLKLSSNKISDINFWQSLTRLQSLNLGGNQISDISSLQSLTRLQSLKLNHNQISDISSLQSLTRLQSLDLGQNQISDITSLLNPFLQKELTPLKIVSEDPLVFSIYDLGKINVNNNPLSIPPIEIVQQGNDAVLYWFQAQDQGKVVNREAKIILLGNGNSGKTTLSFRLRNNKFVPLKESDRTHGILIETWNIPQKYFPVKLQQKIDESIQQHDTGSPLSIRTPESLQVHLWDFGGQEYYHATHRLFMSSNILYLLLWETGTDHQDGKNDYPVAYWQKSIRYLSPENITLCVQNKVKRQAGPTDDLHYKIEWCNENDPKSIDRYEKDIEVLKEGILEHLSDLSYVGALFPKVYDDIREALRKETKPFISYSEYKEICNDSDSTSIKIMQDDGQKETLIRFLDDTGAVVCFRFRKGIETAELKEYVFTSPNWLTQIIYEILEREIPEFDLQHVETVIANQEYRMDAKVWIEIMKQFELIFEIEKKDGIKYVVPQFLPLQCTNQEGFDLVIQTIKMQPTFTLKYPEFLPKSNFLRLIAKYGNQNIRYLYWKSGLLFSLNEKTIIAECISNEQERKIIISVQDKDAATTKEIFESLIAIDESEDLQVSINEKDFVLVKKLKEKFFNNNIEVETTAGITLPVATFDILFGKKENEHTNQSTMKKDIKIFVSYSSKDRDIRELLVAGLKNHLSIRKEYNFHLWSDKEIDLGSDWKSNIEEALAKSEVAILLVSASFAASTFIQTNELAEFLKRKKEGGYLIIPVLIRNFNFSEFQNLAGLNFFKTYFNENGFNQPAERHKLMPFDVLADNDNTKDNKFEDYYRKLADAIQKAVTNHFAVS